MTRILLFDIDGTLIESGGAGSVALNAALKEIFGIEQPARVPMHGRTDAGIVAELFAANGIPESDARRTQFLQSYLDLLPQVLRKLPGRILPGVQELLDSLAKLPGLHTTLLTGNMARSAAMKLNHFGLDKYFQGGVFGDHHPDRRDLGRTAMEELAMQVGEPICSSDIVLIGDTPLDIECGRAIGCKVLAVATGGCSIEELDGHGADRTVLNLSQPGILEWLVYFDAQ